MRQTCGRCMMIITKHFLLTCLVLELECLIISVVDAPGHKHPHAPRDERNKPRVPPKTLDCWLAYDLILPDTYGADTYYMSILTSDSVPFNRLTQSIIKIQGSPLAQFGVRDFAMMFQLAFLAEAHGSTQLPGMVLQCCERLYLPCQSGYAYQ